MTAVLDELIEAPLPPPELSIADKLRWVLERVSGILDHGLGRGGVAAVLADSDPEFTLALRTRIADQLLGKHPRGIPLVELTIATNRRSWQAPNGRPAEAAPETEAVTADGRRVLAPVLPEKSVPRIPD